MTLSRRFLARGWPLLVLAMLALSGCALDDITPGLRSDPANTFAYNGDAAARVGNLYMLTFWAAVVVGAITFGALFVALWRFRARPGNPIPKQIHGNTTFELTWTILPTLVLVGVGIPTIQTLFEMEHPPGPAPLQVDVIGHQWWWEFRYPEQGITTASELHIPLNRSVRVSLQSDDVVHSFWPARLSGKRDTFPVPASTPWRQNHMWFNATDPGTYYGQCAEFCGIQHAQMRFWVVAEPEGQWNAWVQAQRQVPAAASAEAGQTA